MVGQLLYQIFDLRLLWTLYDLYGLLRSVLKAPQHFIVLFAMSTIIALASSRDRPRCPAEISFFGKASVPVSRSRHQTLLCPLTNIRRVNTKTSATRLPVSCPKSNVSSSKNSLPISVTAISMSVMLFKHASTFLPRHHSRNGSSRGDALKACCSRTGSTSSSPGVWVHRASGCLYRLGLQIYVWNLHA